MPDQSAGGSFVVSSCRYPTGMLDGSDPHYPETPGPADRAEYELLRWYEAQNLPKFTQVPLLRLGDQVYVDATAGLFDPTSPDVRFQRPYAQRDRNPSHYRRERGTRFVEYCVLDDHEIDDNWEPTRVRRAENQAMMERGREVYIERQRSTGLEIKPEDRARGRLWRDDVNLVGCPFFFADTRTERSSRTAATIQEAEIMSQAQTSALLEWLKRSRAVDGRPRFVVSSSMLLPRRLFGARTAFSPIAVRCDNWEAYPRSLYKILGALYEEDLSDVIFLSGDEHLSNFTSIEITKPGEDRSTIVHSIHSSPLYAPFTFANSSPADFAENETFEFPLLDDTNGDLLSDSRMQCKVSAEFTPHVDGFCVIRVHRERNGWTINMEYQSARDGAPMLRSIKF